MMFTEREEVDVADHHHLVVLDRVEGAVEGLFNILLIALREETERLGNPLGSLHEPFASRILTQKAEDLLDQGLQFRRFSPSQVSVSGHAARPTLGPAYSK